jgi:FMN phosphatase YigB (HAD superfamily)
MKHCSPDLVSLDIKTPIIAFDLMDTLIRDPYRLAHEAATGMPFEELETKRPDGVYHALERGEIGEEYYWYHLQQAGIAIDVNKFHDTRCRGYAWLPGMKELLVYMTTVYRVIIASNYPVWIHDVQRAYLADLNIEICSSCQLGVRKPSLDFFIRLCARHKISIHNLLLIDDSCDNVRGACAAGANAIHFTGATLLRQSLVQLGLIQL